MLINWMNLVQRRSRSVFYIQTHSESELNKEKKKSNELKKREGEATEENRNKHNKMRRKEMKKEIIACEDMHKIPATELFMHAIRYCYSYTNFYCHYLFFSISLNFLRVFFFLQAHDQLLNLSAIFFSSGVYLSCVRTHLKFIQTFSFIKSNYEHSY